MTTCDDIRSQLGPYLDGELPVAARSGIDAHLLDCANCRTELRDLRSLAGALTGVEEPRVPASLWPSIERQLDAVQQRPVLKLLRVLPRARLATAAAIVLVVGIVLAGVLSYDRRAAASEINFAVLLDALPFDVHDAFAKFVAHYGGRRASVAEAARYATALRFATPEELPGGFRLREVYTLRVGKNPGVAARYERDGEFLAAIFHPPVRTEEFGSHKDYPCVVGQHRGHMVAVGEWKLVHLTDPTTCHCVLSRLDEERELPAVMAAVAPGSTSGDLHLGHP